VTGRGWDGSGSRAAGCGLSWARWVRLVAGFGLAGAACRGFGGCGVSLVLGSAGAACHGLWLAGRGLSWVLGSRMPLVVGIRHDKSVLS